MAVIGTSKSGFNLNLSLGQSIGAFEFLFSNMDIIQIPQSVHQKIRVQSVLVLDEQNQVIYPPTFIQGDGLIIIESSEAITGKVIIF